VLDLAQLFSNQPMKEKYITDANTETFSQKKNNNQKKYPENSREIMMR
jgi:hypothetical protein